MIKNNLQGDASLQFSTPNPRVTYAFSFLYQNSRNQQNSVNMPDKISGTKKNVSLKILYTLTGVDSQKYIVRPSETVEAEVFEDLKIGIVAVNPCLTAIKEASPDFSQVFEIGSNEYAIYSSDYSEDGYPLQSHGRVCNHLFGTTTGKISISLMGSEFLEVQFHLLPIRNPEELLLDFQMDYTCKQSQLNSELGMQLPTSEVHSDFYNQPSSNIGQGDTPSSTNCPSSMINFDLPELPELPELSGLTEFSGIPDLPRIAGIPGMPSIPGIPGLSAIQGISGLPIPLPRSLALEKGEAFTSSPPVRARPTRIAPSTSSRNSLDTPSYEIYRRKRPNSPNMDENRCSNCGVNSACTWRKIKGNDGKEKLLCNACGLYYKTKKVMRPSTLWEKVRVRTPTVSNNNVSHNTVASLLPSSSNNSNMLTNKADGRQNGQQLAPRMKAKPVQKVTRNLKQPMSLSYHENVCEPSPASLPASTPSSFSQLNDYKLPEQSQHLQRSRNKVLQPEDVQIQNAQKIQATTVSAKLSNEPSLVAPSSSTGKHQCTQKINEYSFPESKLENSLLVKEQPNQERHASTAAVRMDRIESNILQQNSQEQNHNIEQNKPETHLDTARSMKPSRPAENPVLNTMDVKRSQEQEAVQSQPSNMVNEPKTPQTTRTKTEKDVPSSIDKLFLTTPELSAKSASENPGSPNSVGSASKWFTQVMNPESSYFDSFLTSPSPKRCKKIDEDMLCSSPPTSSTLFSEASEGSEPSKISCESSKLTQNIFAALPTLTP